MISIRKTITDLEQCETLRRLALDCYVGAIRNIAHYAVELDEITEPYKKYVEALAAEVEPGTTQAL